MISRSPTGTIGPSDAGFTLIELLVVILIVGVLAAVAIPTALAQRERSYEAGIKSDLRHVAVLQGTYYVDALAYTPDLAQLTDFLPSRANSITIAWADDSGFCVDGSSTGTDTTYRFDSAAGGLATGTCAP